MKRYTLKAVNDDATECEICGRVELKRVMWIAELDVDGNEVADPFACGVVCGANLLKQTVSKVNTRVNNFEGEVSKKRQSLYWNHPSYSESRKVLDELNLVARGGNGKARLSFQERHNHPLYETFKKLDQEARDFANSQDVSIELVF
jgi:hypothetical protein